MGKGWAIVAGNHEAMSEDDRELLESLAVEIAGELRACGLVDAEGVWPATMPVPVVEIEYPEYVVTLTMSVHHHAPEDMS